VRSRTARLVAVCAAAALGTGVFAAGAVGATTKLSLGTVGACCKFTKTKLTARAGTVSITLNNTAGIGHNVAIKGGGVNKKARVVTTGKTTVTAKLKKGKYTFYCSVPGHEASGMKGTLTVK
jgi:plastocyanin